MNNEAVGVLGSLRPQRSVMDRRLQAEFNRENYTGSESVGVLGSANPNQRSVMDRRLQAEFNPLRESYCHLKNNFSGYENPYNPLTPNVTLARLK